MKRIIQTVILTVLCFFHAFGQTDTAVLITVYDPSVLTGSSGSSGSAPIFNNSAINAAISGYTITSFEQAYPFSRFPYLKSVYRVIAHPSTIGATLNAAFPAIFPRFEVVNPPTMIGTPYTPNDFSSSYISCPGCTWQDWDWYLEFIQARQAWGEYATSKGDSNVIIGVTDNGFFLNDATYEGNPDLITKVAMVEYNGFPAVNEPGHGTLVAGLIAGATDNGIGFPAIGFKCRLDLYGQMGDAPMLFLSGVRKRKILNASWYSNETEHLDIPGHFYSQGVYDEVYENGTVACFASGNHGLHNWWYQYPSSLDHIISTTGVMGTNCTWVDSAGNSYQCLEHNITHGDTTDAYHHNDRVDLCAPAVQVGGLYFDGTKAIGSGDRYYTHDAGWGTSFASPLVAGTLGLVESVNPCLSPYQQEVILKRSARDIYTGVADNAYLWNIDKWHSRAGAGALDADAAVKKAHDLDCNDPSTQTMFIEGIEINTVCAPGHASNSVNPKFIPIITNGTPPYTYNWQEIPGNTTTLDSYTGATPTVVSSTGTNLAYYRLTVYDASEIQKVANRIVRVQLRTDSTYDLAMRDSYMDMLSEPDSASWVDPRDWNVWLSPDIWNRQVNDSIRSPQNVQYFSGGDPNFMFVRVRNVGCADYPPADSAKLHAYWTLGSTGENWRNDWTTAYVAGNVGTVIAGREITTNYGNHPIALPLMHPGDTVVYSIPWNPIDPTTLLGSPTSAEVCGLARITEPTKVDSGMYHTEVSYITPNVINNNNIVTRNMTEVNLGHKFAPGRHRVYVANPASTTQKFGLQLITDRMIQPHFAGNLSEYMYVDLKMEKNLYGAWVAAGRKGNYAKVNSDSSISFDPSTMLRLDSISFPAGSKSYVDLTFKTRGGIFIDSAVKNQKIHFRQVVTVGGIEAVFGDMSYSINIEADSAGSGERKTNNNVIIGNVNEPTTIDGFIAYPVPATSTVYFKYSPQKQISIKLFDMTGRLMDERSLSKNSTSTSFDVRNYAPGIYWYQAITEDKRQTGKLLIKKD